MKNSLLDDYKYSNSKEVNTKYWITGTLIIKISVFTVIT
jgi:hypothetical protein